MMTDEYKICAGQMEESDADINSLVSLDFVQAILRFSDELEPESLFEAYPQLPELDITYLYALVYGSLEHKQKARGLQRDDIGNLLLNVQDRRVESFITELIQNAQDLPNQGQLLKMAFEVSNEKTLHFSHNGPHFSPSELVAACRIGNSTKTLNLHAIGRFGLGLKYWRMFFSRIQISSRNEHVQYSLVEENHNQGDTFIPFVERKDIGKNAKRTTKFTFSKPNEDFVSQFESVSSLFSERLSQSLPLLIQRGEEGIGIFFKQHEGSILSEFSLKSSIKTVIETGSNNVLEIIDCEIDGKTHSVMKSSLPISCFQESLPEEFRALKDALASDYVETMVRLHGKRVTQNEAEEIIAASLESTSSPLYLSVIYDPTLASQGGYLASKFIGLDTNFESAPILFDAPFRLLSNRQQLNMEEIDHGKAINTPLIGMICSLLEATFPHTISDPVRKELALNVQHYDQLLNGSFRMETSPKFTKLFENNTQLFSILKSTPDCGVVKGKFAAPASLMDYWRTMVKRDIDEEWFWGALNPSIARIEIENGDQGPIQVLLGENIVPTKLNTNEPWFDGIYGEGIPDDVSKLYLELNEVQLPESQHLGTTIMPFDGGNIFFASEKAYRFVKKFDFEADTIPPNVDAFHRALGQALRASSSEHELYGVVHEHRVGTKTTWKPTEDLEIISHFFELSLNPENEPVLSKHNICNHLETRFREDVQSENAPKTYTLLKDSQNHLALVKRPETHYVACVLVGLDQYEMCSIKYTGTGLNPKEISFDKPPYVKVWGSDEKVLWFTRDVDIDVPQPHMKKVTEHWKRIPIHTSSNSNWNWIRLNQIVNSAQSKVDRVVIVDLIEHDDDVEPSMVHNLGVYANTRSKTSATSFGDEHKPKNRKDSSTRNITLPSSDVNDVNEVLLAKVLYQAQGFPSKAEVKFPSGDTTLTFMKMNYQCSGDRGHNYLTMAKTGHVSTGMSVKVDQRDTTYQVKEIVDQTIVLSSQIQESIDNETVYFNQGMKRREHAILRFNDLATHVSLGTSEVNDDELKSYLSAYDRFRWLKGRKKLSTYAYDCYWRNRIQSGYDLMPRCTKIHAGSSDIGVITAKPDGVEEIPRIFDNVLGFTEHYRLDILEHIPRDLMLRKFAGDSHPLPFVINPEDEVAVPLIEGLRGFAVESEHSATFDEFAKKQNALELLVRGVLDGDDESSLESLKWLNNLLQHYDTNSWFGQSGTFNWGESSRYPSTHLKEWLVSKETFDADGFKSNYPHLHGVVFSEKKTYWSQVQDSVHLGTTAEVIKTAYAEAILPLVSVHDGVLAYNEDTGPKASVLGPKYLLLKENLDLSLLQVLHIQDGMQAVLPSQNQEAMFPDKIIPILESCEWISDCPRQSVYDILIRKSGTDKTEVQDDAVPPAYRWLLNMRNKMPTSVRLNILNGGEHQPAAGLHYSNNCISMVVHDSKSDKLEVDVYLPSEPTTTLSYEQWKAIYDLFMSTMKKHARETHSQLPMEIDHIFLNYVVLGPWTSNRRDDCIEEFDLATSQLNDTIYERFANASDGDVEQFLNEVVRMYQHEKEIVKDTKESLRQQPRYYGGLKAVIPTKWSTNSQLHPLRSIWYWALPNEDKKRMQEAGLPEGSIGEYMLLNLEEDGWFSAKMDTGMMRCKFVDDYASRMKTALIGQCKADASNPFVEIPGLIFEEKAEETLMMVLNKVHLLFILGGLRAGGVPDA